MAILWDPCASCKLVERPVDLAATDFRSRTATSCGNLGNANSHDTRNLPILLAGGGFRHGRHVAYDPNNNGRLCNLFVTMLQRLGVETGRFGSSSGTLTGFDA